MCQMMFTWHLYEGFMTKDINIYKGLVQQALAIRKTDFVYLI